MRLWHKDLIPYLPREQLVAQWRECCAIANNIAKNGTPNHLLVNKILDYSCNSFINYSALIIKEMRARKYKISDRALKNLNDNVTASEYYFNNECIYDRLYKGWHNERYLRQCLFNLQEKYDCGGIPEEEWKIIEDKFKEYL